MTDQTEARVKALEGQMEAMINRYNFMATESERRYFIFCDLEERLKKLEQKPQDGSESTMATTTV